MGIISRLRAVIKETMLAPELKHKVVWWVERMTCIFGRDHMPQRRHGYINNITLTKLGRNSCQQR